VKSFLLLLPKSVLIICVTEMCFVHTTVYFQYKYHKGSVKVWCCFYVWYLLTKNWFSCLYLVVILCQLALPDLYLWTREN